MGSYKDGMRIDLNVNILTHLLKDDLLSEKNIVAITQEICETCNDIDSVLSTEMKKFIHLFVSKYKNHKCMQPDRSSYIQFSHINSGLDKLLPETAEILVCECMSYDDLVHVSKFTPNQGVIDYINSIDKGYKCLLLNSWWFDYIHDKSYHVLELDYIVFSIRRSSYLLRAVYNLTVIKSINGMNIENVKDINSTISSLISEKLYQLTMSGSRISCKHEFYDYLQHPTIEVEGNKFVIKDPESFHTLTHLTYGNKYIAYLRQDNVPITKCRSNYVYQMEDISKWLDAQLEHSVAYLNLLNAYVSNMDLEKFTVKVNYDYFDGYNIKIINKKGIIVRQFGFKNQYRTFENAEQFLSQMMSSMPSDHSVDQLINGSDDDVR